MTANNMPERGIDFDDFIGSLYFKAEKKMDNVQFTPVFCPANGKHDDDFIGIHYQGYQTRGNGKLEQGIMYPAKNFTEEDLKRLFEKTEAKDGSVSYKAKANLSLDEVYIRVCYSHDENKEDNIKWVAGVDGGEIFALHGNRREYKRKEAEV